MKLLKPEEVSQKLGMSKAALPNLRKKDQSFPQPIMISQRVNRWDEADIDNWLIQKKEKENGEDRRTG
jgi:predicted DNA-binding transcriptional regulator AlpA|tara:strand:+ start:3311 stop:3514 length:204 start_codon:yes stop_codon:yes gene_type:complete